MRVPEVHVGTTNSEPSLYDYQILLCDATCEYVLMSFGQPSQRQLVLLYDDSHYDVITSLPGFFGTSYFCARCLKPYNNQGHHACDNNPVSRLHVRITPRPKAGVATSRVLRVSITSKPSVLHSSG